MIEGRLGSIVIPAHNEANVIERTLSCLAPYAQDGRLEVIVVANGCSDATAARARDFRGVRVIELAVGSKVEALRAGDAVSTAWPRLYLDADIEVPTESVVAVLNVLRTRKYLSARPKFEYVTDGADWIVRQYYLARSAMPSLHVSLWGAGVYGLSYEGRQRFDEFPSVVADDLFVDRLFVPSEKAVISCRPALVRTPLRTTALLRVLGRVYAGQEQLSAGDSRRQSVADLRVVAKGGLKGAVSALIYATVVVLARLLRRRRRRTEWARDTTSR